MLFRSRENAKQYLRENPFIRDEIENQVRLHYNLNGAVEEAGEAGKEPEEAVKPAGKEPAKEAKAQAGKEAKAGAAKDTKAGPLKEEAGEGPGTES